MTKLFFYLKALPRHIRATWRMSLAWYWDWSSFYDGAGPYVPLAERKAPLAPTPQPPMPEFEDEADYNFMLDKFILWLPPGAKQDMDPMTLNYMFCVFVENERQGMTTRH